ncbi:hypothetical protein ACFYT4_05055 [Streptomyces sp. NPDC004609]|uniref:hypothetical protein n=1 Tax=Streptomyces sp. NPDC004609 TaxID=3364704 RepID=UPI0036CF3E57
MKFLTRLGDTLLNRLAPETEAWAADNPCLGSCSGACLTSYTQEKCIANRLHMRCCYSGGGACPAPYCGPWKNCGLTICSPGR